MIRKENVRMLDLNKRRHPLETFLSNIDQDNSKQPPKVSVGIQLGYDYVNLRGDPSNNDFVSAVENALNQSIPLVPNTISEDKHIVYWLGPDEWLVTGKGNFRETLSMHLKDHHASINSQTGGLVQLNITGKKTRQLIAKGSTLDLHPRVFLTGHCAQSGFAKASILIALNNDDPLFTLIVRRSYAEYVALWLKKSGEEFFINFSVHN